MVSNVSPTGGADGSAPLSEKRDDIEVDGTTPTTRHQDGRLPTSAGPRAPASGKAAPLAADLAGRLRASRGADRAIDPGYIEMIEAKAIAAYPPDANYAPRVFQFPPSLSNPVGGAKHSVSPYNPLGLRVPFHLISETILYGRIVGDEARVKAITSYLELAKQYNLSYVEFLRAASGSDDAVARLKTSLLEGKILDAAGVQVALLAIEHQSLLHEIQGHLCLDVLRCPDVEVPTTARIRALEIVRDHFDVTAVAEVLSKGILGLVRGPQKIYDLIPERFITTEEERTKSHASRFLRNGYIKSLFPVGKTNGRPFSLSALELASKYPEETVQTLLGFIRMSDATSPQRASAFQALIRLTSLDEVRKERIFGVNASYRNGGKSRIESPLRADGDVRPNDPAGYFRALCLHPETPDEDVIALAQATYAVLASKYRNDRSASDAQHAAKIAEAYEVLADPAKLRQYRLAAQ